MLKSALPNALASIFQPISADTVALINGDSLCLQSAFFLNKPDGQEINVSLTNLYLAVFQPHQTHPEYLYEAELTFDLKFETIHELDGKGTPEQAVMSRPVGFRIIKENAGKI
jgi:hypothetical protein